MSDWKQYAICPGCGSRYFAPFGKIFHIHFVVCPRCGELKREWRDTLTSGGKEWPVKTMRYVSTGRFLSPSTWGTGHWETRDESASLKARTAQ